MKAHIFAFFITLTIATSAFSQMSGNPDNWCREGLFTRETKDFGVGFVKAAKTSFHDDQKTNCPAAAGCKTTSYVVKGDTIITNKKFGAFTCGWFTSAKGGVKVGWLRTADLDFPAMLHDASERVWIGEWSYASNTISFTSNKLSGFLNVAGTAIWKGLGDNVHVGELDGRFSHKDGVLEYSDGDSEYDCKATMQLAVERYLIVADNGNCGGANVTFSGIYRKVRKK